MRLRRPHVQHSALQAQLVAGADRPRPAEFIGARADDAAGGLEVALDQYPMLTEPGKEITWESSTWAAAASSPPPGFAEVSRPSRRRVVMRIDF
jgi:hypothetical protein